MDFRTLNYVVAIAKYQNLTRAAEALYVGQPTLSKFLANLEDELGLKLFQKVGHRYVPTYAGERYIERANALLTMKSGLVAEMADILEQNIGVVNVAFAYMRCSYLLPIALPAFQAGHPNVRVNVYEGSSGENDRRLLEGAVDVAFYSMPSEPNAAIEYIPIAREELLICAPKGHPIGRLAEEDPAGGHPRLDLAALKDERVLMMQPQQRTRQIVDRILRKNRLHYDNVLYTSNIQAIIGLVASGYGVSFVFDSHLKHRLGTLPIDCYSFGEPRTLCDFVAARRRGGYLSHHAQNFIDVVRQSV